MSEKLPVEVVGGIRIGRRGDPRKSVIREFAEKGILIDKGTIDHWRRGDRQAGMIRRRFDVPEVIAKEGAARKNRQFLHIIEVALREKEKLMDNSTLAPSKRYGLADSVAGILRVPPGTINISFRLMRADVCLAKEVPESIAAIFEGKVNEFRSKYPLDSNKESALTRELFEEKWNGEMKGFNEALSKVGPTTVKAWVPYELETFQAFYLFQQRTNTLTFLDKMILENWRSYSLRSASEKIRDLTGVSLEPQALALHIRMLDGTLLPKVG